MADTNGNAEGGVKQSKLKERADAGLYAWKVVQATGGVLLLLIGLWTHFLGPGIQPWFQDFSGNTQTKQELGELRTELNDRLDFVETFMPAPPVVDWNLEASQQIGACTQTSCLYSLVASRTSYGEACGKPVEAEVFVRTSTGRTIRTVYAPSFRPIELTRRVEEFTVPLIIPPTIPVGAHAWRSRVVYPTCPGRNEPVPRFTPWFPLTVSPD